MGRFRTRSSVLLVIACSITLSALAQTRNISKGCDLDIYRPIRIGNPIRGGHEAFATEKVAPTYPPEALRKGIGGRVDVQVLINQAGDVIKVCGVGKRLLVRATEEAVLKWRFQKDFGLTFVDKQSTDPRFAVLRLSFDFRRTTGEQEQQNTKSSVNSWPCAQKFGSATDERGIPIWLGSDDLMHRVVEKSELSFPMLGHGHLRGEVKLDLVIDEQGKVTCISAISGHPIAVASAMDAVPGWRFRPFIQHEKKVPVLGHLTVPYAVDR